jgi:REP element-mobilizing transposase RayT
MSYSNPPSRIDLSRPKSGGMTNGQYSLMMKIIDDTYRGFIKRYTQRYRFQIFAYYLITNHIHLLLRITEGGNISQIMQVITMSHTQILPSYLWDKWNMYGREDLKALL